LSIRLHPKTPHGTFERSKWIEGERSVVNGQLAIGSAPFQFGVMSSETRFLTQ
jgi:hypothetical protein